MVKPMWRTVAEVACTIVSAGVYGLTHVLPASPVNLAIRFVSLMVSIVSAGITIVDALCRGLRGALRDAIAEGIREVLKDVEGIVDVTAVAISSQITRKPVEELYGPYLRAKREARELIEQAR